MQPTADEKKKGPPLVREVTLDDTIDMLWLESDAGSHILRN